AAVAFDCEHFVNISSDKAVRPTSVMGATKRIAEMIVQQAALKHDRKFVSVRFGNVLGSRGSVVPIFLGQIKAGGPVTVTHPDMQRYFMTIPEAVQLVLQAAALGVGGEVFLLDMGAPVKTLDLACDLIRLSGLRVGEDIEIKFTGVRPGEKLYEEMFFSAENVIRTDHPKVLRARNGILPEGIARRIDGLLTVAGTDDVRGDDLRVLLKNLVPDFHGPSSGPRHQEAVLPGDAPLLPRPTKTESATLAASA
ncbi:MAG TPA: polysaccharide biosynthesis protein, partial [Gemmatimonadaceae bacterium]|nr:polysaccharide biosynthesis protein [Gemmatimonadaceae bacterium]